jgi:glutamine amidotransferase
MGNLASVARALQVLGFSPYIAESPVELRTAARLVLPGVGAFAEGMDNLEQGGWADEIKQLTADGDVPLLGICLGMQFLADAGVEGGARPGLGLVPGEVQFLGDLAQERVPHVGWNELHQAQSDPLLEDIPQGTDFYFVHSYAFVPADPSHLLASVQYGAAVAAIVRKDNVWGAQFHPEKSSRAGLQLLRNFVERAAC